MCQHSKMNMIHEVPPDLFYADPGFVHPENVHMLLEYSCFFQQLRPCKYTGNGRVPTLQETEVGWILAGHVQQPGQPFRAAVT